MVTCQVSLEGKDSHVTPVAKIEDNTTASSADGARRSVVPAKPADSFVQKFPFEIGPYLEANEEVMSAHAPAVARISLEVRMRHLEDPVEDLADMAIGVAGLTSSPEIE
ncbi:hypothetical protein GUJ93_ZPchr0005g14600 [Zizania palustris]|uniref:Uncharacterized protein n=1 Tax=Zizania palustris TaxID=103762 RepID=A0A8J5SHC4_ZIZPA|nr:hypothetical protein GUJ93_ZPchr0005g14600 [Zizania palustris]